MTEILSDLEVSMDNYLNMSFHCGIQKSLKVLVEKMPSICEESMLYLYWQ